MDPVSGQDTMNVDRRVASTDTQVQIPVCIRHSCPIAPNRLEHRPSYADTLGGNGISPEHFVEIEGASLKQEIRRALCSDVLDIAKRKSSIRGFVECRRENL